jgi:hypothetical protein
MAEPNPHLSPLTPALVMDLRGSVSTRGSADGTYDRVGVPFVVYSPSEDAFVLHAYGSAQAMHKDPRVLAQVMRCERAEAGFIRRILSALEPCDVATLEPDVRARHAQHRAQEAARQRQQAEDLRAAQLARRRVEDPSKLSLNDL